MTRQIIQRGIEEGEFKSIDVDEFVVTLTALIEGLLLLNTIDKQMFNLQQHFVRSLRLLLDSIKTD